MAKEMDFTKTGGLPLTQNRLGFMQDAYREELGQLTGLGISNSAPVIISGMVVTVAGSDVTVTDGWFVYGGKMIRFTGSTVTLGAGEVAVVLITASSATLPFNDGSTPTVIFDKSATLTHVATVTDATHFPITSMVGWIVPPTIEARAEIQGDTVNFAKNRNVIYAACTPAGGSLTFTLGFTGAQPGAEVVLNMPSSGGGFLVTVLGSATFTGDTTVGYINKKTTFRFKYLGNLGGTNYVHFEGWQY